MAKRRKKVSGTGTTILWIGGGLLAAFALYEIMKGQSAPITVIKTSTPASSSAATTAAEVTAGASVLTAGLNDLFGDDSD